MWESLNFNKFKVNKLWSVFFDVEICLLFEYEICYYMIIFLEFVIEINGVCKGLKKKVILMDVWNY